jgi:hypothetical protein
VSQSAPAAAPPLNGLGVGHEAQTVLAPDDLKRMRRRILRSADLTTLRGTATVSARIIREVISGHISRRSADVLSRCVTRHSEVLGRVLEDAKRDEVLERLGRLEAQIQIAPHVAQLPAALLEPAPNEPPGEAERAPRSAPVRAMEGDGA